MAHPTMTVRLHFTPNLYRHLGCPDIDADGASVREVLADCFARHPGLRGYLLDDQGALRPHVAVFLNQAPIRDRTALSDPVNHDDEVFVVQALSGG